MKPIIQISLNAVILLCLPMLLVAQNPQYQWSNGATTPTIDVSPEQTTTYYVTVTDGGTTITDSVTITVNNMSLSATTTDVSTCGASDGSISLNISGGTAPFSYNWSNGATNQNLNNLDVGNYSVTVTDSIGCFDTLSVELIEPGEIVLNATVLDEASCYGGQDGIIEFTITGGVAPFNITSETGDTILATNNTTHIFNQVAEGTYSAGVMDANGCVSVIIFKMGVKGNPDVINTILTPTICGDANGSFIVDLGGAFNSYDLTWSHNAALSGQLADNLPEGSYSVTISNEFSCDTVVNFTINNIPGHEITDVSIEPALCGKDNGVISVTTEGGTGGLTYNWTGGLSNSPVVGGLAPGEYSLIVVDENGCVDTASAIIVNEIDTPLLTISPNYPDTIIPGGSVQLDTEVITFGEDVVYNWTPENGLNCTTCPDPMASPMTDTDYHLLVTDVETGCMSSGNIRIIVKDEISIPNAITPDGDGINDTWVIRDLRFYEENEVVIVTRWGDEVFRASPYMNDFDGTYRGMNLPEKTYYYIIRLKATDEVFTGSLTILR